MCWILSFFLLLKDATLFITQYSTILGSLRHDKHESFFNNLYKTFYIVYNGFYYNDTYMNNMYCPIYVLYMYYCVDCNR